ncbi:hypothetical protein NQ176_g1697 [Zarea fungicola]|uniref:Uncharacterized protein n=1 Tax=Zarea fungicola TaxID=93591 RepID=A0ACC1NU81_9HYPO|nr:hypothetical protein NQ176_g1697 [Lecanicillium fungicola]
MTNVARSMRRQERFSANKPALSNSGQWDTKLAVVGAATSRTPGAAHPTATPRVSKPLAQVIETSAREHVAAGARASTFQTGHGTGTSHVPINDSMMSGTPPSEASPEDLMNTMNQLKHMIERMRQGKGHEEGQPLSDLHSASQNGAPTATMYDNQSHEMEYLRNEMESFRKQVTAVKQEVESVRSVVKQLQGDNDSMTKMTTESLESLRDQLSLLVNSCPLPEEDPFAYPPLPSA